MDQQRNELLSRIDALVLGCGVSDAEKQIFGQTLVNAPLSALEFIAESFTEDEFELRRLVESVVKKYNSRGNVYKMKELIEQDKYEFDSLLATISE